MAIALLSEIARPGVPDSEYYFSTLGDAYKGLQQYEKALKAYSQAENEVVNELGSDKEFLSGLYLNIAEVYEELGDSENAKKLREKAKGVWE